MSFIRLADEHADVDKMRGPIGLLFECAPDSLIWRRKDPTWPIDAIIGDFESVKVRAATLAKKLIASEPKIRGVGHLRIFEEIIIRTLQSAFYALALCDALESRQIGACEFATTSRFSEALLHLQRVGRARFSVHSPPNNRNLDRIRRMWKRLRREEFGLAALQREFLRVRRHIDPYGELRLRFRQQDYPRDQIWFYSTARNYTQIGMLYEPHFPGRFCYIVDNPLTDAMPLKAAGRSFYSKSEFAIRDLAPSRRELGEARDMISRHVLNLPLGGEDAEARELLLISPFMHTFLERHLPIGMFEIGLFDRWIQQVQPRALVAGNTGFEGYAFSRAQAAGIPTVVLQHGILGDFCQFADPPVDHYIVRGKFWHDFLAPAPKRRAIIANPPLARADTGVRSERSSRSVLTYFTCCYEDQEYRNLADLDDILRVLLRTSCQFGRELIIRVHPEDSLVGYRNRAGRLSANMEDVRLTFDQGTPLDPLLKKTAVAVLHSSTAFLDCVRLNVPIVSPGWQDFSYKKGLEKEHVFYFGRNLEHFGALVSKGLMGQLPPFKHDTRPFLADTSEAELRALLRKTVTNVGG